MLEKFSQTCSLEKNRKKIAATMRNIRRVSKTLCLFRFFKLFFSREIVRNGVVLKMQPLCCDAFSHILFIFALLSYTTCQLCWGSLNFLSTYYISSYTLLNFFFLLVVIWFYLNTIFNHVLLLSCYHQCSHVSLLPKETLASCAGSIVVFVVGSQV